MAESTQNSEFETKLSNYSLIIVGILTILLVGFVFYSNFHTSNQLSKGGITGNFLETSDIDTADNSDGLDNVDLANSPQISLNTELKKLGTISQTDGIVKTNFEITNTGKTDLVIDYMETSCICTSVSLNKDGIESPRFGMIMEGQEIPKDFKLEIAPGESARLNVFYDPLAHGVQEKSKLLITRTIAIYSNDPVEPIKQVKFSLKQKK